MRRALFVLPALAAAALAVPAAPAAAVPHPDLGRQVLAAGDGWGSDTTGVTGGASAAAGRRFTVRDRAQLAAALATGDTPKIIYVDGAIEGNTAPGGARLTCADYATGGYTLDGYLAAYAPETWGTADPSGPMEDARAASQKKQAERVVLEVPANTTIVGLGSRAALRHLNLMVRNVDNVIIRNLTFEDAADCFPAWDPTDGATGNWNSEYDNLTLTGATHVWVDHNTFTDGANPDSAQPLLFGRPYQVHDGELDMIKGTDQVTASWNVFTEHDKTDLIGSSDSADATDAGRLRITFHHNLWDGSIQRAPRVRFGRVDVYNNSYVIPSGPYEYSWGVGKNSGIVAELNSFAVPAGVPLGKIIHYWKGTAIREGGNLVNGEPADLLAAYNAAYDPDLTADVGWTPVLRRTVHRARDVRRVVAAGAGAGRAGIDERITVGTDAPTVQAAVDAAPAASARPVTIVVPKGRYREVVTVPADKPNLRLEGGTRRPEDTVITYDNASGTPRPGGGTYGTTGSATVTIAASDFTATGLTFENAFDEAAHPEITARQAVAVKTTGDRVAFDGVRFLGNQDTLYLDSAAKGVTARVYVRRSYVEGDVDFIFGRAAAVLDRVEIMALARNGTPAGYVTAASTVGTQPYGFLIIDSAIRSTAPAGSYHLGRPWHPGLDADGVPTVPSVVVRETRLPSAISRDQPWTDMSGFSWRDARFAEYRNHGPGFALNPGRPQLTDAQAAGHEIADYLGDWTPPV
ncbi:pectinesterase family protein [Actinocorallia longicatena]|uniref:Pectate lyase domain-containing protein n=1 Tax=Actinocorallia longicatena TaxID=111803 RepID=A0ABP6QC15_9ACTN